MLLWKENKPVSMSKAKGFLGEYSIGLSIVPCIKKLLHQRYEYVTPLFPWMTREGSNISKYLHRKDQFKVFGIYPRRPKLKSGSQDIEIKINAQIIAGANGGLKLGIPIIAGCPLVRNFWELSDDPKFIWTKLEFDKNEDFLIKIKEGEIFLPELSDTFFKEKHEILDYINENARIFSIEEALKAFREIKMTSMNLDFYPRFGFGGVYKPVYFLLKN